MTLSLLSDPLAVLLVLTAPVAGSFLALCADRLARDESIVMPRSFCRACGQTLGPRDLVPLLSYLIHRGGCRHCGAPIPRWLFLFELLCLVAGLAALWLAPSVAVAWAYALFLWLLLALAAADLLYFRLPNLLTGALLACALALSWLTGAPPIATALWGALIGAGSFWALRYGYHILRGRDGLGMGDVKLMAGLGAALGPEMLPIMVLLASLSGLAAALVAALLHGRANLSATRALPFGAALAGATGFLWLALRMPV